MKTVNAQTITETIAHLCIDANRNLPKDVAAALYQAEETEPFAPAKDLLSLLTKNEQIARTTQMPICQDTGMAVVFADVGQDVHIAGDFAEAVNEGVRRGYVEGLLRKSVVGDPLRRVNTGDNTPAVLHTRLVPGDTLTLTVAPKGFGSENMSQLRMLTPASGIDGVKRFVLDTVRAAGANPCPPMVLGIGIGGDFEQVAENAKRALMLPLGTPNPDPFYAQLEEELLEAVNQTGIGVQGLGGRTTCLGLHIIAAPTHIAGLPVAVNVSCHVTRPATAVLGERGECYAKTAHPLDGRRREVPPRGGSRPALRCGLHRARRGAPAHDGFDSRRQAASGGLGGSSHLLRRSDAHAARTSCWFHWTYHLDAHGFLHPDAFAARSARHDWQGQPLPGSHGGDAGIPGGLLRRGRRCGSADGGVRHVAGGHLLGRPWP